MHRFLQRLAVIVLLIALGGRGWADEAVRTWTLPNGRVVEARLVKDLGDTVQLQTPEGKTGTLRVDGLTEGDRAYVESLRAPAPAAGPEVLVIYSTEFQAAEAIVQLLNEYSFKARMQSTLTVAEQPRLGGARLVVLSRDTESWCTSQSGAMLVREVRQTKRAVLAIGLAGTRLYSRMELSIGRNPVAFTGDSVLAQEPGDVVFTTPQDLGAQAGATLRLYEKANTVYGILIDPKPAYVAGLATVMDSRSGYLGLAVEDELYGFWGFGGSPQIMSEVGRQLFVNLANRLVAASAEQEASEPEPAAPPAREEPAPEPEPEAPPPEPGANAPGAMGTRIYQPGTEPTYPPKTLDKFQVYPTSKDARAASLSYDLEVTLRTVDNEVLTSRSRGLYNQSRHASGNYRYRPLVRVTARNKDIAANSILGIEYYRRSADGGSEKNLAGVQHVVLPEIKRGASVLVEASGISLFKSEYRARYGSSASGFELFGVVAGLFDPDEKFLFQVATQQSLKDLASPTLLPADL